ncbi:MAG: hypothetical protein ACR2L8_11430 [Solirubrobacteraceae bacterium]
MRSSLLAASVAAFLLLPATAAVAGDPIMPLGEVRAGMKCTGYSVVRGTDIAAFDVEVIDVVDDRSTGSGPRILFKVGGAAVDETGLGPGFSGSPIYCPDAQGTQRTIGAISESIGEYGGKVALATPIEAILGNPVDAPRATEARATLARAKPLAAPLTVTGLNTRLGSALQKAAAKRGRMLLAAPAGPLGSFPVQQLRPGSAFGVGYASGDISASAIGTVAYTDADRVWGFGHPLDGVGARSLLLQDAYVFRVVNNPLALGDVAGTYKYAAAGHDIGTLSNDALTAVVGRVGGLPTTVPVRVSATDLDTGAKRSVTTNVADETSIDQPTGGSILPLLAPLAVLQAAGTVLGGSPARLTGRGCFAISFKEAKAPVRFCNRYVSDVADALGSGNVIAGAASSDLVQALLLVEGYKASELHVTGIDAGVQIRRGQRQAFLRSVRLPRRARAGTRVKAALTLRHVRGKLERRTVKLRLPDDLPPGRRRVVFTGADVDSGEGDLFGLFEFEFEFGGGGGELGPPNLRSLIAAIDGIHRYDGVSARGPRSDPDDFDPGLPSYRDPELRISGRARATIKIGGRRAPHRR